MKPEQRLDQEFGAAFGMEDGGPLGVAKALSEFKSLDYGYLVPVRRIFSAELMRKKAVRWVLVFGLLPLVFAWYVGTYGRDFIQVLWLIEIYFCLFWAFYFYSIIRPSSDVWHRAIGYALFTTLIGIPILLSLQSFPVIRDLYAGVSSASFFARLTGFVLGVGVLEETCKALPLILFGLRRKTIHSIREGVFLRLLFGFGFPASEGVSYTFGATVDAIQYGAGRVPCGGRR